jgi:hypothetical protein
VHGPWSHQITCEYRRNLSVRFAKPLARSRVPRHSTL